MKTNLDISETEVLVNFYIKNLILHEYLICRIPTILNVFQIWPMFDFIYNNTENIVTHKHTAQNSRSLFRVISEISKKSVVLLSQKRLPDFSKTQVSN